MKLGDIEFVYSGRKDGVHRQGVGLMVNKKAAKSCLGWEGINNLLLVSHFMTKKFRVSVIVVYAPVGRLTEWLRWILLTVAGANRQETR